MATVLAAAPAGTGPESQTDWAGRGARAQPRLRVAGPRARRERLVPRGELPRAAGSSGSSPPGCPPSWAAAGRRTPSCAPCCASWAAPAARPRWRSPCTPTWWRRTVWLWRQGAPVAPLLERIAAEQLVLVTTGASDWLDSSGTRRARRRRLPRHRPQALRQRLAGRRPAADQRPLRRPHRRADRAALRACPCAAEGITVLDNWRTMAMRASGSNDIVLDGVFVPEGAVSSRRPKGRLGPVPQRRRRRRRPAGHVRLPRRGGGGARPGACSGWRGKRDDPDVWYLVGEMENALVTGQLAVQGMIDLCADYAFAPDVATANAIFIRKTIAAQALLQTAEKALEAGRRGRPLPQQWAWSGWCGTSTRAQFHPLQAKRQHRFTGRLGARPRSGGVGAGLAGARLAADCQRPGRDPSGLRGACLA